MGLKFYLEFRFTILLTVLNCQFELTRLELRLKTRKNLLTAALDEEFS